VQKAQFVRTADAPDLWLLEFSYQELAEYYPGMTFPPQQRVAFAAELYDAHTDPSKSSGVPANIANSEFYEPPQCSSTPRANRSRFTHTAVTSTGT
jgi:hypothetical protein